MTTLYNPDNQYRCTIIRGKSLTDMENLLPLYARIVHVICPCEKSLFDHWCDQELAKYLFGNADYNGLPESNIKTIKNHKTEIMGKLLGLYYVSQDGDSCIVHETESCNFLYEESDFPAFFKNLSFKMQFPNAMQKVQTVRDRMEKEVSFRPLCYVVALLQHAERSPEKSLLTNQEIGYYVLNNLDVLRGGIPPNVVYQAIMGDRAAGIRKPKLQGSKAWQHIKELLAFLELANLVEIDLSGYVSLVHNERSTIDMFVQDAMVVPFDMYEYNLDNKLDFNKLKEEWAVYYGNLNKDLTSKATDFGSTIVEVTKLSPMQRESSAVGYSTIELGDKGESLVYNLEYNIVGKYKKRLLNKVLLLGKTKGLGYDISSIEVERYPQDPMLARYIEVKTTTRVSEPSLELDNWSESINLTEKEWVAAKQHGEHYYVYRVYFTKKKVVIYVIGNPYGQYQDNLIDVYATNYRMDFTANNITEKYVDEYAE